jgi:hypothetical protein
MVRLKTDLAGMPDDRLFAATVDGLIHRYRVDLRDLECVLLASQDSRRRFLKSLAKDEAPPRQLATTVGSRT